MYSVCWTWARGACAVNLQPSTRTNFAAGAVVNKCSHCHASRQLAPGAVAFAGAQQAKWHEDLNEVSFFAVTDGRDRIDAVA